MTRTPLPAIRSSMALVAVPIPASKPQPPASHVLNRRAHVTGVRGISPEQAWVEHVRRQAKGEGEWHMETGWCGGAPSAKNFGSGNCPSVFCARGVLARQACKEVGFSRDFVNGPCDSSSPFF